MSIYTKWLISLSLFCAIVIVSVLIGISGQPVTEVSLILPIPQVNLAKIYVVAVDFKRDMEEQPEIFDEEPNEHMIRNNMVFNVNYNNCREEKTWDDKLACRDTITQREVDLVRLAYTDLDSFTIEVEE